MKLDTSMPNRSVLEAFNEVAFSAEISWVQWGPRTMSLLPRSGHVFIVAVISFPLDPWD